jgi:hypothetical protein
LTHGWGRSSRGQRLCTIFRAGPRGPEIIRRTLEPNQPIPDEPLLGDCRCPVQNAAGHVFRAGGVLYGEIANPRGCATEAHIYPQHCSRILVSYIANLIMRCLKTNGPLGFSPNEPFAGPSKLSAVIASGGSRAAFNWRGRIQLGRLIGSAPYTLRAIRSPLRMKSLVGRFATQRLCGKAPAAARRP